MSQLVNVAGAQLKPHLPVLLPALLEATGELESANLAYLSTRYGADADKQEMIDSVRAAVAKSHYSTETMTKVCSLEIFILYFILNYSLLKIFCSVFNMLILRSWKKLFHEFQKC